MSPVDSPDLHDDLGWSLGVLLRSYRDRVTAALGEFPHGTRGYEALAAVLRGGHDSQLSLAGHLGIDRTVMTYLVDDLEAEGLVERKPNPADRRQRQIVVTDRGRALLESACDRVVAAQDEVLGALAAPERAALRSLLNKAATATGDDESRETAGAGTGLSS